MITGALCFINLGGLTSAETLGAVTLTGTLWVQLLALP